jgi:hypothetical protein
MPRADRSGVAKDILTAVAAVGVLLLVASSVAVLFEPSYRSAHCYPAIPGVGLRATLGLLLASGAAVTALVLARRSAISWLVLALLVLSEMVVLPVTFILGDPGIDVANASRARCGHTGADVTTHLVWMHLPIALSIVAIAVGRPLRAFRRASWLGLGAFVLAATGVYVVAFWPA